MTKPYEPPMATKEIVEKLNAKAKERREYAAYVTANRDDWFATAPADLEENTVAEAVVYEEAVRRIQLNEKSFGEIRRLVMAPDFNSHSRDAIAMLCGLKR